MGELLVAGEVAFQVRPLNGPGTMGPTVLAPSSEAALVQVRDFLVAHPDEGPLRIECTVNPRTMSGMPTPRWPAGLARQITRWLVEHGADCTRLRVVGRLDETHEGPAERVRFFVGDKRPGPRDAEAYSDACAARD